MEEYSFECDVQDVFWRITPTLPSGIEFKYMDHVISGKPLVESPQREYNITVENDAGFLTLTFSLDVHYCNEGFYLIRTITNMFEGTVVVKRDEEILEDSHIEFTSPDVYYCTSIGSLHFKVTCLIASHSDSCFGMISSTTGMVYLRMTIQGGQSVEESTSMIPLNPPSMWANTKETIAALEESFSINLDVKEIYHELEFQPPLPSSIVFDKVALTLKGCIRHAGRYEYTLLSYNSVGNSSLCITFYIDDCPSGNSLIRLRKSETASEAFHLYSLEGKSILSDVLSKPDYKKNVCVPPHEYWIQMASPNNTIWDSPLNVLDLDDTPIEQFMMIKPNQRERFVVGDLIPFGSVFRYKHSNEPEPGWTQIQFLDKSWKQGTSSSWGMFNSTKYVLFRRELTVHHPTHYSLLKLVLIVKSPASVYLNGNVVATYSHIPSENTTTIIWIPTTLLKKKQNVLAIQCEKSSITDSSSLNDSPIIMDIRMHLATTQCITPNLSGEATDTQEEPVPSHGPSLAFDDGYSYWQSDQLPVSLFYYLNDDYHIMPTQMRIGSADIPPTAFTVVGLQLNHMTNKTVEDTLASVQNQAFLQGVKQENVVLHPKRAYNAFRIDFTDSVNHETVQAKAIAFTICQQASCPKRMGIKPATVGGVIDSTCPWGMYGIKHMICGRKDVEPHWIKDTNMCIPKYAPRGMAYIDTSLRFEGVRKEPLASIVQGLKNILVDNLKILESRDEVSLPIIRENTVDKVFVDAILRVEVTRKSSRQKFTNLKLSNETFIKTINNTLHVNVSFRSEPILRLSNHWIIGIVCISLLVIFLTVFIYIVRNRQLRSSRLL